MDIQKTELPVRIGISSCLLGERVRYDGGHKRNDYLTDVVSRFVEWVPVCPEAESGMGIPREPIQLTQLGDDILVLTKDGVDYTEVVDKFAEQRIRTLERANLSGYILKSRSPTCGMVQVPIIQPKTITLRKGRGIYANRLIKAFPYLPIEEDIRLQNPRFRENLITRVFAYNRWLPQIET